MGACGHQVSFFVGKSENSQSLFTALDFEQRWATLAVDGGSENALLQSMAVVQHALTLRLWLFWPTLYKCIFICLGLLLVSFIRSYFPLSSAVFRWAD